MKRLFVALLALGALAAMPSSASAAAYTYCGNVIGPDAWCGAYNQHYVSYNRATYPGYGTVRVGIKQIRSTGATINRKFADNYVATNSTAWLSRPYVANASNGNHTVNGYFETSTPIPTRTRDSRSVKKAASPLFDAQARLSQTTKELGIENAPVSIARDDSTGEIAVARGTDTICLAKSRDGNYVESCSPLFSGSPAAITEDLSSDVPIGLSRVTGVVSPEITSVSVRLGNGSAKTLSVVGGVYTGFVRGTADQPVSVTAIG